MTEPRCITCDGQTLKALAEAGKNWLEQHYKHVNELNVFPVPDGDTGTNMLLTIRNAYKEVADDTSNNVAHIAGKLAKGAVMGSRGNSGTIMSQIWAGFAEGLDTAETFDLRLAVTALRQAATKAYQGVQTPVEGTILTVIREMAEEAEAVQESTTNLVTLLDKIVMRGWDAVQRTPDMLPILKEAGVVDSGGTGLVYIVEGMLKHARGEVIEAVSDDEPVQTHEADLFVLGDEKYNYDVQFIIRGENLAVAQIKQDIEAMGDSGVIIGDDSLVKVHIHVDYPSVPIAYAEKLGVLEDVVVENMQAQYEALLAQKARQTSINLRTIQPGEIGVIAVAPGRGLASVLADLGAAGIVDGGQTNNPSTEEILNAARGLHTDKVIVLPNNKNIILAVEQAVRLSQDIDIVMVPTVSFPQGIAAMLSYQAEGDLHEVAAEMSESKNDIVTGEITTATRTVELDGVAVQEGQTIGLLDGKLRTVGDNIQEVVEKLLQTLDVDDYELLTLYYGDHIAPEAALALADALREQYEDLQIEVVYGGQPHYHYILGIE